MKVKNKININKVMIWMTTSKAITKTSQNVEVPNERKRNTNEMSGGSSFLLSNLNKKLSMPIINNNNNSSSNNSNNINSNNNNISSNNNIINNNKLLLNNLIPLL
jgi:hypothetical protein